MKLLFCLVLTVITMLSTISFAYNNSDQLRQLSTSQRFSSEDLVYGQINAGFKNNSPKNQIYFSFGQSTIRGMDCNTFVDTVDQKIIKKVQIQGYFIDYIYGCVGNSTEAEVVHQITLEPTLIDQVDDLASFIQNLNSFYINEFHTQFLRAVELRDSGNITGQTDADDSTIIFNEQRKSKNYESFQDFYDNINLENKTIRLSTDNKYLAFTSTFFSSTIFDRYLKLFSQIKQTTFWHLAEFKLENQNNFNPGIMKIGNFRNH